MSVFLFCFGVALSQFYIFSSGTPQPAHYIIVLAIFIFFASRGHVILPKKNVSVLRVLFAFVIYQAVVNFVYFIITKEFEFLMQLIYILYGFAVFLLMFNFFCVERDFLKKFSRFGLFGLLILFCLPFLGLGEYRIYPRYNAFFNDPNQMAFWVLCVVAMNCFYYRNSGNLLFPAFVFAISCYLIVLTASRSGLVGFSILAVGFLISFLKGFARSLGGKNIFFYIAGAFIVIYGAFYIIKSDFDALSFLVDRVDVVDPSEQARVRGYTKILEYPERVFFGAGHGMEGRFDVMNTEIHSTWAGVLFYYGLPGLILLVSVVFMILKRLDFNEKLIFLGPIFYSFSTFGLRTPIFWIFLGFFYVSMFNKAHSININGKE